MSDENSYIMEERIASFLRETISTPLRAHKALIDKGRSLLVFKVAPSHTGAMELDEKREPFDHDGVVTIQLYEPVAWANHVQAGYQPKEGPSVNLYTDEGPEFVVSKLLWLTGTWRVTEQRKWKHIGPDRAEELNDEHDEIVKYTVEQTA